MSKPNINVEIGFAFPGSLSRGWSQLEKYHFLFDGDQFCDSWNRHSHLFIRVR